MVRFCLPPQPAAQAQAAAHHHQLARTLQHGQGGGPVGCGGAGPDRRIEVLGRCTDYNPATRNAYFGDTHVHTAASLDANLQGTRLRTADAYRFARGEEMGLPADMAHAAVEGIPEIDMALAEDFQSRRLGITGVPYLIFNGRFGLSGAQEPEVLYSMFDLAREDDKERLAS
mgnify:CR=1 FL=1